VRRRAEEQELRRAEPQRLHHATPARRQRLGEKGGEHRIDLAQAPQRRGEEIADEGAIARLQPGEPLMSGDGLIKLPPPVQDLGQDLERDLARVGHARAAFRQLPALGLAAVAGYRRGPWG
jgi:hypothetical protein